MASGSGAAQIPVSRPEDLKASPGHVPIEVRHRAARRLPGLALGQGFGDPPHAEFVVLQPCVEIRHQRVQQVVFRLVGMTEVGAPRHVAHDVDTGLPKRAGHDDSSSGLANPARPRRQAIPTTITPAQPDATMKGLVEMSVSEHPEPNMSRWA